jgi:hypothetical protein
MTCPPKWVECHVGDDVVECSAHRRSDLCCMPCVTGLCTREVCISMLMMVGIKMLQEINDADIDVKVRRRPHGVKKTVVDRQLYFDGTGGRGRVGGGPGHGGRLFDAMLDSS